MKNTYTTLLLLLSFHLFSQNTKRVLVDLSPGWQFTGGSITGETLDQTVDLPHTWNATDAQAGFDYYRGEGAYHKKIFIDGSQRENRFFLHFGGAHTVADVYFNGVHLGQHRGGYSAFAYEITPHINFGAENNIVVEVDNRYQDDVLPLGGDFNMYGGLYRPVHLLITDKACVSPLDYASPGVYISQKSVREGEAEIEVLTKISNTAPEGAALSLLTTIEDADSNVIAENRVEDLPYEENLSPVQSFRLLNPKLWNGRKAPYLYRCRVRLYQGDALIDEVVQPVGLRYFKVAPNEGFFLNGSSTPLRGVSRHQDLLDKGSALSEAEQKRDMELIEEIGANTIRLAHYQHSRYFYSLCDSSGMVIWAEIPFVGSLVAGFNNTPEFKENARQQLIELIRQNYNHPSIVFWGIYNELSNPKDNSPAEFVAELQELARQEDPYRLTTAASFLEGKDPLHFITDVIAWNKYFGWYYGEPEDLGGFLDNIHSAYPELKIGISEYGAGASIEQHAEKLRRPFPFFHPWHPEAWQTQYHEESWKVIADRPYLWGTYVWNMFDFSAAFRDEGDAMGRNDKGLVTFDRKVKKDAFFFYKANWNPEPMVYITDRRFKLREKKKIDVKAYANLPEVELFVNERSAGKKPVDEHGVVIWNDVELAEGNNAVRAVAGSAEEEISDAVVWMYKPNAGLHLAVWFFRWGIKPIGLFALLLIPYFIFIGFRQKDRPRWRRIISWIVFSLVVLIVIAYVILYILASQYDVGIFDYSMI